MNLRPYQQNAIDSIWRYFQFNKGNPLLALPTGSGKSIIQAGFIKSVIEKYPGQRFLLLSHVKELLEQNTQKLIALCDNADIGIYSAGLRRKDIGNAVTIAGIQSIYAKAHTVGKIDLIIIDECHLVPRKGGNGMYRKFIHDMKVINPHIKIIGMTATPYRLDSGMLHEGKDRIFTDIAYEADIGALVTDGYLCPLVSKQGSSRADLGACRVRMGEYLEKDLEEALDTDTLVKGAIDETLELCQSRNRWLVFCTSVKHAHHVCKEIQSRGISCDVVTGKTPAEDRRRILGAFKSGRLRALTNVNVLTTGFDAPDIDAIIMLRPTLSTGLYVQMLGRGMRPHETKQNTLVLDFTDNVMKHGPIDYVRVSSEEKSEKADNEAPAKVCPECREIVHISVRQCRCGYEFRAPEERKIKHTTRASDAPVMGCPAPKIEEIEVDTVEYAIHRKAGKPNSLKVAYNCGLMQYHEWVLLEHQRYPRYVAEQWWLKRSSQPPPSTVAEAVLLSSNLKKPKKIRVNFTKKYPEVIGYEF